MGEDFSTFYFLGVALAIGLLIGVERGWRERKAEEGERIAGVRTYGLIGLLGGCAALLSEKVGPISLGLMFVALAGVLTAVYAVNLQRENDVGITSLVTGLLTFLLGAMAVMGEVVVASALAVVTALLLSYKPQLHRWVRTLEQKELHAGIKLLLISVVLLPALPNRGFGPWEALNPYAIWWMVVLIASISFVGYFAVKIGGARHGTLFTGLFGGLASSTALTLHFSRLSRSDRAMGPILSMGILFACGTMFPRMLLLASALNPRLFEPLLLPTLVMALLVYLPVLFYWRLHRRQDTEMVSPLKNPLELKTAVVFGLLLALVMLLGKALKEWFGDAGLLALAAASGVADVDAITLSLARMRAAEVDLRVVAIGLVIAASANSLTKAGLASIIGGGRVGLLVGIPLLVSALSGVALGWWLIW
ncbi:MgtC/SapB family protein [Sedimenticola hydrogenitrophicus]|uniref:MgtC/SapB family protein n=1 Tax=Sedimenticola hydrogenitrophicus TaxID=2967975 RepID=UPI0023B0F0E9|nr:MgtC/SapB family protein [Sedimenticola hydrogenitrophicus]